MTTLNGYTIVDRHNRPNVNQPVGLRALFINDGIYQDPVDISGVTIFAKTRNLSPSTVLNATQLVDASSASSTAFMHFGVSSHTNKTGAALDASDYNPGDAASGIYREGVGRYIAVLDGTQNLSGLFDLDGASEPLANEASAVLDYIDVWTVKLSTGSNYKTVINNFHLYDDTFFVITEPLLLKTSNKLLNKHIEIGSKVDLKMSTEVTLENKSLDESVINLFKDSVITSAAVEIKKINESPNLSSRVTVSSFANTSSVMQITPDNTLIFNWDTDLLDDIAIANGGWGSTVGVYSVQGEYTILNQKIRTPIFYVKVR